jgi:hypothetical protein
MISKEAWAVGVCVAVLLLCGWLLTRDLDLPPRGETIHPDICQ